MDSNTRLEEEGCDGGGREMLEMRIREANELLAVVESEFANCDGCSKFANKIKAELHFLNELKNFPSQGLKRYTETSNVVHFRGIIETARRYAPCSALCKSFCVDPSKKSTKLEVDLVVDSGAKWVKVISRSARGLAMAYVGAGGGNGRSIVEQAQDYLTMSSNFPHFFVTPTVVFEFTNGVPDLLAERIESLGVVVCGKRVPIEELVKLPAYSDSESEGECDDGQGDGEGCSDSENKEEECSCSVRRASDPEVSTVNLDVTAVFALISALTHEGGALHHFESAILNSQAVQERSNPVLQKLRKTIAGKQKIMCRSAYDALQSILSTVAGAEERRRARELLETVTIVDDHISERASALRTTDKISQRSKIIFGSGDYYRAVTISANRRFLSAAAHQGIRFAAILHEPRALSEQKEPSTSASSSS